jgi:hypothetical protein
MEGAVPGNVADALCGRSGHFDGALEEPAEILPALRRSAAQGHAEVVSLGVAANERFGKDDELGPLPAGLGGEVCQLLERAGRVEQDRGRLDDRGTHRVGGVARHLSFSATG